MVRGRRRYIANACRGKVSDGSVLQYDMEVVRYYLLRQITRVGVVGAGGRSCVDVGTGLGIGVGTAPAAVGSVSAADGVGALGFFLVMIQYYYLGTYRYDRIDVA